mgnify:CR=1 FL=1
MSKSVRNSRKQHRNHGHRASLRRTAEPAHIKPRPGPTARKRKRRQSRARRRQLLVLLIAAVLIALIAALVHQPSTSGSTSETNITHGLISDAVVAYRDVVADYAEQNGISEYTDVLLAIMQVESGGELDDLMQSSGSLELPSDSLQQEASIRQGCSYFAHLLHRAESEGCDLDTVIQAYNYGSGFIDYVAEHGGKYPLELSEKFAQQQSGGATVPYDNPVAVKRNDGWRYAYGNMFYAKLVNQHLVR